MLDRRTLLKAGAGSALVLGTGAVGRRAAFAADALRLAPELAEGVRGSAILDALPGKKPLIKLTYRPPNYETPVSYFDQVFTPNDAFFVRYHLADIPELDAGSWRLRVGGEAAQSPFELTLDQLRREFAPVELAAVCMCSGNRRGLFDPHVPGVQWGLGAMGNARWKGARLKDVLARAGLKKEAVEIVLDGADAGIIDKTPDFVKSLPVWKALDENTLVAYEMNGAPLPHFNGAPARIVVPGWTATYWMKHVVSISAATKPFDGFWMKSAYRIPKGKFAMVDRFMTQETEANTPITEMMVNSIITSPTSSRKVAVGRPVELRGIAWDGGYGIRSVEVSSDGGASWRAAALGEDHGRFSFRPWSYRFQPSKRGEIALMARAANRIGGTQTSELIQNPAGYHHNLMPRVSLVAA
jgi:DMSO/TMAO reductase YedYZ molybdopterin-dependent catalytic subunit